MIRAFFCAIGVAIVLLGLQCLAVERVVVHVPDQLLSSDNSTVASISQPVTRELVIPEWAPWALLSAGAITVLYSQAIARRLTGDE
ncbi:MAG: hypothetical protein ACKOBW_13310 [Planctomycetota bacterium]